MADQSHLDQRYFVDETVYNCPFCNRRNVSYRVTGRKQFDWSNTKECIAFFTRCDSCEKDAMHLAWEDIKLDTFAFISGQAQLRFSISDQENVGEYLDNSFFYSVPTSFFVMDDRVPRVLRELMDEAEGCLKANLLTGASACARKLVYELAVLEEAEGDNYDARLKSLKVKRPEVDPTYFDTLLTVQEVTSSKVHENSYDGWEAKHLRIILAALLKALHEMYVVPQVLQENRKEILALKDELIGKKASAGSEPTETTKPSGT